MRARGLAAAALFVALSGVSAVQAAEADVVAVEVTRETGGTYHFSVTLSHGDTGWDHYADAWDVVAPDGSVLGKQVLFHPHVNEQPFKRSLSGVVIGFGIKAVTVRAHDSVHGFGGASMTVQLPQ